MEAMGSVSLVLGLEYPVNHIWETSNKSAHEPVNVCTAITDGYNMLFDETPTMMCLATRTNRIRAHPLSHQKVRRLGKEAVTSGEGF